LFHNDKTDLFGKKRPGREFPEVHFIINIGGGMDLGINGKKALVMTWLYALDQKSA
jgi:hypothetical protein